MDGTGEGYIVIPVGDAGNKFTFASRTDICDQPGCDQLREIILVYCSFEGSSFPTGSLKQFCDKHAQGDAGRFAITISIERHSETLATSLEWREHSELSVS